MDGHKNMASARPSRRRRQDGGAIVEPLAGSPPGPSPVLPHPAAEAAGGSGAPAGSGLPQTVALAAGPIPGEEHLAEQADVACFWDGRHAIEHPFLYRHEHEQDEDRPDPASVLQAIRRESEGRPPLRKPRPILRYEMIAGDYCGWLMTCSQFLQEHDALLRELQKALEAHDAWVAPPGPLETLASGNATDPPSSLRRTYQALCSRWRLDQPGRAAPAGPGHAHPDGPEHHDLHPQAAVAGPVSARPEHLRSADRRTGGGPSAADHRQGQRPTSGALASDSVACQQEQGPSGPALQASVCPSACLE